MSDELIQLLHRLGETHRPVVKQHPDATPGTYQAQCPACDGSTWKIWRQGDPAVTCEYWRDYSRLWGYE